jgi:non-ribosomal peptide synthetase component F
MVEQGVVGMRRMWAELTKPAGPYPLAEEEVKHHGTVQHYKCWQRGPNSLVLHTLPELYSDSFARHTDREFLLYEGERFTYGKSMEITAMLARELHVSYGVTRGQCVAIAARNYPEWVFSFLALTGYLGAVALPVNSWWSGDELRYGLEDSQTSLLIADLERIERAPFLNELGIPSICVERVPRSCRTAPLDLRMWLLQVGSGFQYCRCQLARTTEAC